MARQFHRVKVKEVKRETPDTVSVTFDIPDNLYSIFDYKHGQYITIRIPELEDDNRRAYSLCSSPYSDKDLRVAVKRVEDGLVSQFINDNLKPGDEVELMQPLGNFTCDCSPTNAIHYILIGGGSGITPLLSIIKTILHVEKNSKITLFYANRNQELIIFKDELQNLENKYKDRLSVTHILSQPENNWTGLKGRLHKNTIKELILSKTGEDLSEIVFFVCGPNGLMKEVQEALAELNVDEHKIKKESFTVELPKLDVEHKSSDYQVSKNVKIILYNEELNTTVEPGETILLAAIREGYDPPFSCQIGACSTCRAKLMSGKVEMDERDALTDEEIEEGYILTCQSHPVSDDVIVNFDEY